MRYKYFTKSYNSKNKKIILILALLIISCMFAFSVYAQDDIVEGVSDLYFEVYSQLDDLDLSELDSIFKDVDGEDVFKIDFSSLIKQIIEGNIDLDAESLLGYFLKILFYNISKLLPTLLLILIVAVILKCLECFSPNLFKDGLFDVINFVAIGIVVIILSNMIIGINDVVYSAIETMQNIINLLFPILLLVLSTMGAYSSVAIYTPISTILTTGVSNILTNYLYPIFIVSFALIIVASLSNKVKIDKFIDFLFSLFKWALGFIFTIFSGVFALKGISAGKYDSVGIFTTKFAIKNYIPLIGSYISEGFNYVVLGSMLVKNAVGLAGVIIIIAVIISPLLYLLVVKLMLQLLASLLELLGSASISSMLSKISKIVAMPIAILLGVAFMFVMCISLVICTGNII